MSANPQYAHKDKLYSLLGDLPPRDLEVSAELVLEEDRGDYVMENLTLRLNGIEQVPAYFARPKISGGPRATILYNHAHGGNYQIGKAEIISSSPGRQDTPYAQELTSMGYNVLCIDSWNFGERRGRTELALFKDMLWHGQVLWGMMVYDSIKAVDYLLTRDDVNHDRIGTLGKSMGSTMAWWLAALDERVMVCVDICCLTDFEELIRTGGLDGHGIYYYVPSLLKHFDTASINALIAPRPHLSLAGNFDCLTPPHGLDKIDAAVKQAYADAGQPDAWKLLRYNCGHLETADMRKEIKLWLRRWLGE